MRFQPLAKLLLLMMLMIAMVITYAQSWSGTYLYDPVDKTSTPVVVADLGRIERPLGLRFDLWASTFAGVKVDRPVAGIWLNGRTAIARNAWLQIGPAITYENNRFRARGAIVGISINF